MEKVVPATAMSGLGAVIGVRISNALVRFSGQTSVCLHKGTMYVNS